MKPAKPIDIWIRYQTDLEINALAFDCDFFWRSVQPMLTNNEVLSEVFTALIESDKEKFFEAFSTAFANFVAKEAFGIADRKAALLSDQSIKIQLKERFKYDIG